jgi:hypothetical protein
MFSPGRHVELEVIKGSVNREDIGKESVGD